MKTYIVCYMLEGPEGHFTDGYVPFMDKSRKKNKKAAKKYWKKMLKREDLYSINICKLVKSSEHYE